jgi:hypothetical protein
MVASPVGVGALDGYWWSPVAVGGHRRSSAGIDGPGGIASASGPCVKWNVLNEPGDPLLNTHDPAPPSGRSSRVTAPPPPADAELRQAVLDRLALRRPGATLCPSEVARALCADEAGWRALMPRVREQAARLADDGRLVLTRRGVTVTRETLHQGPLRIGHPPAGDAPVG